MSKLMCCHLVGYILNRANRCIRSPEGVPMEPLSSVEPSLGSMEGGSNKAFMLVTPSIRVWIMGFDFGGQGFRPGSFVSLQG